MITTEPRQPGEKRFFGEAETNPAVKGNSATARSKPATLETGHVIQVPEHIAQGEGALVDTRTGEMAVASATCVGGIDLKRYLAVVYNDVGVAAAQGLAHGRLHRHAHADGRADDAADAVNGEAEGIVIRGDRIEMVGTSAEVEAYIGPDTEVIDLEGNLAIETVPG